MTKAPLYNIQAEKIGEVNLSQKVFGVDPNHQLLHQSLHSYLGNQRTAHAKTKHRGEVAGTTKKMWSQKGTGRARHGSAKAPIFVGGGSAHGPRGDRNFKTQLSRRQRTLALYSILSRFAASKSIIAIDRINTLTPKTKSAWHLIDLLEKNNQQLAQSPSIGIVVNRQSLVLKRAFGNIPGFTLISLKSVNPYLLASQDFLIFSHLSLKSL